MTQSRREFPEPVLVISQCLEFEPCRYDGAMIHSDFVRALKPHVRYRPVCPEVEVGLGTPRDPIRLVASGDRNRLVQPTTGRDLTDDMEAFGNRFLGRLDGVDGFILKSKSPSCGPDMVRIFGGTESPGVVRRGAGLFAAAVLERHGDLAVEHEGRLRNHGIRDHFLSKLFALARLREVKQSGRLARLVAFHAAYKFLLLAYNEGELRNLGWTVANTGRQPFDIVFAEYRESFTRALAQPPASTAMVNVFQHIYGFFGNQITREEREHFHARLERYREGQLPAAAITTLLESWAVRFGVVYILDQALFAPFPGELATA